MNRGKLSDERGNLSGGWPARLEEAGSPLIAWPELACLRRLIQARLLKPIASGTRIVRLNELDQRVARGALLDLRRAGLVRESRNHA